MTTDNRVRDQPAINAAPVDSQPAERLPHRKPWYGLIRKGSLAFWLVVAAAGLVLTITPSAFAFKVLLGPAVIGAGITGLLSEFTFCFDRREDDFDLQVQHQQYVDLEGQVGQVDGLVKKTEIVAVNQMFKLGVDLYNIRFLDDDQAKVFRDEAKDLADILKLTIPVEKFLNHPYLLAKQGPEPEGQDPFPDLKRAVQLRYWQYAGQALAAGSTTGTILHTAGGLTDKEYQEKAAGILKNAMGVLYLLPEVYGNLARAIRELEEGAYRPNYIAGYLTLFTFYLTYRMTGECPDVVPLFESPVSLSEPSTIAEIERILTQMSGQPVEASEQASQPEMSHADIDKQPAHVRPFRIQARSAGDHLEHKSLLRFTRQEWNTLFGFIRKGSLVFWFAVSAAGLVLALAPVNFAIKVLMSSAVVGAGIAGLLSEFTYAFDRQEADFELKKQRRQYLDLRDHIGRVDELLRRAEIVSVNQMLKLGIDISWIRYGKADQVESFLAEAKELADFIGLSRPMEEFLESPYLRPAENPPPEGQDPMPDLMEAVARRYVQEGLVALQAGITLGVIINLALPGEEFPAEAVSILNNAIKLLHLPPKARDNMLRALQELENGSCTPRDVRLYFVLFSFYLDYRMTGDHKEVVPLFESRVSLAQPSTVAEINRLMNQIRTDGRDGTPEPVSGPENSAMATSDVRQSEPVPE